MQSRHLLSNELKFTKLRQFDLKHFWYNSGKEVKYQEQIETFYFVLYLFDKFKFLSYTFSYFLSPRTSSENVKGKGFP